MFTPQRRPSPAVALTPRSQTRAALPPSNGKGKAAVAFGDGPFLSPPPPPPVSSLGGGGGSEGLEVEGMEDWRRFKEAGLLDEAVMERKDREALLEKASRLEKELFDYQYNMGLLIMEKKEWTSKYEEMRQALEEAQEILKRDQSAHGIALSEIEGREENLRKALDVEKQCVVDLEKALRDLQKEHVQIKHASEARLADVRTLILGMEKKSLDVEEKMHSVEAKLSEVNTKSLELDMKLQEIKARERVLQKERHSLNTERETHEATVLKQRQDLHEWERKLHIGEERLSEVRKTLNSREGTLNENDKILKQKAMDLEDAEKNIDLLFTKLKEREANVDNKLADLIGKEKNADCMQSILDAKEKELLALKEKINAREQIELQNLLDEQKVVLDAKMQKFELELQEKGKILDEELGNKVGSLEQHEAEIFHKEEKLRRQEQALDKKSERVKEKERDLDVKLKNVDEKDRSIKTEQEQLELERLQFLADRESLQILESECQKMRAKIAQQEVQISVEREGLQSINNERSEFLRLQSELKKELDKCRHQEEFLLREAEDLTEERNKFEKEWEVMEEKRAQISKELKDIAEERRKLEKAQQAEEEELREEKHAMEEFIKRELDALRMEKESLEARITFEKSELSERAKSEHEQMVQEFESQRRNFESDMIHRHEEMEKGLRERERAFEEEKETDLSHITYLKETARRELEEIRSEKSAVEKRRQEVVKDVEKLGEQQSGMQKDIAELELLRKKLKEQREQLVRERSHFLAFVEKLKGCKNCGDITGEFILSDLHPPDMEVREDLPMRRLVDEFESNNKCGVDAHATIDGNKSPGEDVRNSGSQRRISWLQRCTSKIFSTSPTKMVECDPAPTLTEKLPSSVVVVNVEEEADRYGVLGSQENKETSVPEDEPQQLLEAADDAIDSQHLRSDSLTVRGGGYSISLGEHSYINSQVQVPDDSVQSELKGYHKRGRRRKDGLSKSHSVKAVVEDAKLFLGESFDGSKQTESLQPSDTHDLSQGSQGVEKAASKVARKRGRPPTENEQDAGDSQGNSESVTAGGRRKRRQNVSSNVPTPGQKRYNLRRHKNVDPSLATLVSPEKVKTEEEVADHGAVMEQTQNLETTPSLPLGAVSQAGNSIDLVHVSTIKGVGLLQDEVVRDKDDVIYQAATSRVVEITELSEGEHGSPEDRAVDDPEKDEDDNDDELEHPGEVSIGKKIWTFFTT